MNRCESCGSYAIRLDPEKRLCDVCLRTRERDEAREELRNVYQALPRIPGTARIRVAIVRRCPWLKVEP
jgi:hypothetical protein